MRKEFLKNNKGENNGENNDKGKWGRYYIL